ncbi:hypothetical protein [Bifidobacterium oedipodis]|uniref:Uncharacterized protein n=1 Tax=Bifidobacterium oedipodis TaxID=2675322 RepID=A0A7Y0HS43_9BIFI|nr:hypothetical protein [Bifidobacterium sp. DSM 109957]NMM93183.1 hypothetical protein [Bifidobacterium sp. DSM 109957]
MTGKQWQVTVDFKTEQGFDAEKAFDLMEEIGAYGASVAVNPNGDGGSVTLAVESGDAAKACSDALDLLAGTQSLPKHEVCAIAAAEWDEATRRNREPLYPKVVGYAEIARMADVSRQRAYKFPEIGSFPKPVIETSQGPLYSESAVEAWLANRIRKAGRPKSIS